MTEAELDTEIGRRRAAIVRAERTATDAMQAPKPSQHTIKALGALQRTLETEKAILAELEKYRAAKP